MTLGEVDFHVVEHRPDGDWEYGPAGGPAQDIIPGHALTGLGVIAGRQVPCVTAEEQVRYHTGYEVDANDWADVGALCDRFGIAIPPDFARFQESE